MKLLTRTKNDHDVNIPELLDSKGVSDYDLYNEKYITHGRAFEMWRYEYKGKNYFLMKHLHSPHQLFFIGLEEDEVFIAEDFDYYLKHGEFKTEWSLEELFEIDKKSGSKH